MGKSECNNNSVLLAKLPVHFARRWAMGAEWAEQALSRRVRTHTERGTERLLYTLLLVWRIDLSKCSICFD